jgi:hypothetical protein
MAFCKPTATTEGEVAAPNVVNGEAANSIATPNVVTPDAANAIAAPNSLTPVAAATIPDLCDGE